MSTSTRILLACLATAIVIFLAMLFWPFIVNTIIRPTALVIWFLLRLLVLWIDQKYFWYAVIFVAFILLFRIIPRIQTDIQPDTYLATNTTITNIGYWRSLFTYAGQNVRDEKNLKRELIQLLTSLYSSRQTLSTNFDILAALEQGTIPLPQNIYSLLFLQEQPVAGGLLKRFFHPLRRTFLQWKRRWTGQEEAEHFQMISEVLNFMETTLEMNNDDGPLSKNTH